MAKKPHRNPHPLNFFLRCFGFPRRKSPDANKTNHGTKKPRKRRFRWSTSRINKSPVRTVPVDHSAELIPATGNDSAKTRRSSNSKFSAQFTLRQETFQEIQLANDSPNSSRGSETTSNRHLESSKFETCKKRLSFCRKADAIQPGSGQPGKQPPHVNPPKAARPQTHSQGSVSSLQATSSTTQEIRVVNLPAQIRVGSKGKHEAALGMSIVIVTLIIMLFWGRLCAILCTSAWFYFFPRLRTVISDNDAANNSGKPTPSSATLDLNSAEHKKRVVLDGFLHRNHSSQYRSLL